jgi:hypothetical protein
MEKELQKLLKADLQFQGKKILRHIVKCSKIPKLVQLAKLELLKHK